MSSADALGRGSYGTRACIVKLIEHYPYTSYGTRRYLYKTYIYAHRRGVRLSANYIEKHNTGIMYDNGNNMYRINNRLDDASVYISSSVARVLYRYYWRIAIIVYTFSSG